LFLLKEISFTLKGIKKGELLFVLSLFISIFYINIIALFPQVFSLTSHVILTLPLAIISWLVINLFG
jgi:F0F1-type ATP synthase membrane subunit a